MSFILDCGWSQRSVFIDLCVSRGFSHPISGHTEFLILGKLFHMIPSNVHLLGLAVLDSICHCFSFHWALKQLKSSLACLGLDSSKTHCVTCKHFHLVVSPISRWLIMRLNTLIPSKEPEGTLLLTFSHVEQWPLINVFCFCSLVSVVGF